MWVQSRKKKQEYKIKIIIKIKWEKKTNQSVSYLTIAA